MKRSNNEILIMQLPNKMFCNLIYCVVGHTLLYPIIVVTRNSGALQIEKKPNFNQVPVISMHIQGCKLQGGGGGRTSRGTICFSICGFLKIKPLNFPIFLIITGVNCTKATIIYA